VRTGRVAMARGMGSAPKQNRGSHAAMPEAEGISYSV